MIVLEDADVDVASSAAVWGAFMNAGQTCLSVERCYVHESDLREVSGEVRGEDGETPDRYLPHSLGRCATVSLVNTHPIRRKGRGTQLKMAPQAEIDVGPMIHERQLKHRAVACRRRHRARRAPAGRRQSPSTSWSKLFCAHHSCRRGPLHDDHARRNFWPGAAGAQLQDVKMKPWRWPTIPNTAWPPASLPATANAVNAGAADRCGHGDGE